MGISGINRVAADHPIQPHKRFENWPLRRAELRHGPVDLESSICTARCKAPVASDVGPFTLLMSVSSRLPANVHTTWRIQAVNVWTSLSASSNLPARQTSEHNCGGGNSGESILKPGLAVAQQLPRATTRQTRNVHVRQQKHQRQPHHLHRALRYYSTEAHCLLPTASSSSEHSLSHSPCEAMYCFSLYGVHNGLRSCVLAAHS